MPNDCDKWSSPNRSRLEADIAYLDARLSLLRGGAASRYQEAQIKAYRELEALLIGRLAKLIGQGSEPQDLYPERIQVGGISAEEGVDGDAESQV